MVSHVLTGACGWQGAAEDDFKISYSQTYTREDSKSKSKSAIKVMTQLIIIWSRALSPSDWKLCVDAT